VTNWAAGMLPTADRLGALTPEIVTTGTSNSSGWSVSTFVGWKVGGCIVAVYLLVNRSGATISATSGNITDTDVCTLPSGYRPSQNINTQYGNGSMDGECIITTAGLVQLRSANADVASGSNIRLSPFWIIG
jgi:hypothetical protein